MFDYKGDDSAIAVFIELSFKQFGDQLSGREVS